MSDDILEIKPGWGPFKVNVNALVRRFGGRRATAVEVVAERFVALFESHGVTRAQIPRFLPAVTLASLQNNETLLPVLTPELLEQAAVIFGIQRVWLEGSTDRLYVTPSCYKNPAVFFTRLRQLPFRGGAFQVRALTSARELDYQSGGAQQLALMLVEKIAEVKDVEEIWDIERYHIFGDTWDWSHAPCRIQLKAIVRVVDQLGRQPVPLFKVRPGELAAVLAGRAVPRAFVNRCLLSEPSLEDYASAKAEHAQAKETTELPSVLQYIEHYQLESLWAGEAAN